MTEEIKDELEENQDEPIEQVEGEEAVEAVEQIEQVESEEALDQDELAGDEGSDSDEVCEEAVDEAVDDGDVSEGFSGDDADRPDVTVESVVESVLFASEEPLTLNRLAKIIEISVKQVNDSVKQLNERYEQLGSSFRIEKIAGGLQMMTLGDYNYWLKKLVRVRSDNKLSPAAMETLAIISYKQPIIRADVEAIRGVGACEMIRSLMYKGLVKIVGRAEILGRPMLYGTTKKFLEVFCLNSLKDLPKIEELKKPAE